MNGKIPEKDKKKEEKPKKPKPGSWEEWKEGWKTFKLSRKEYDEWLYENKDPDRKPASQDQPLMHWEADKHQNLGNSDCVRRYCTECGTRLIMKEDGLWCRNPYCYT